MQYQVLVTITTFHEEACAITSQVLKFDNQSNAAEAMRLVQSAYASLNYEVKFAYLQ